MTAVGMLAMIKEEDGGSNAGIVGNFGFVSDGHCVVVGTDVAEGAEELGCHLGLLGLFVSLVLGGKVAHRKRRWRERWMGKGVHTWSIAS